ncbi:hypothetical protein V2N83_10665 [Streptococcus pneumoniae]
MKEATKTRGRQHRPTRSEVAACYDRLRSAADQGNVQAAALLIALAENRPLPVEAVAA